MRQDTRAMERRVNDRLEILHEKLEELYSLEDKGWRVDGSIEKVWEEIHKINQQSAEKKLKELRNELSEIQKDK